MTCTCDQLHAEHRRAQQAKGVRGDEPCTVRCPGCCAATWDDGIDHARLYEEDA